MNEHKTLKVDDVTAKGCHMELYDYGDGDVFIEMTTGNEYAHILLSPADVIQIAAFCREAFERGKTNED